ncbi:MAG: glycosyltransferase [Candidatus Eremiobacteraeota bacterium]|nr:glycosyltransferase [Candidatus Eremiobacteraeota bacterium]
MRTLRVMHVITDLGTYGAERFLLELLTELPVPSLSLGVTLVAGRSVPAPLRERDIDVCALGRSGRYDFSFLPRMVGFFNAWKPDIVHTHTHHGKYWGRLAAVLAGVPTVVHSEHNSDFRASAPFVVLNRLLHRRTKRIVALSETHGSCLGRAEGVPSERIVVIPNGIRLPRDLDREAARRKLGTDGDTLALMHVGRLCGVKNQRLALAALSILSGDLRLRAKLFFAGDGDDRAMLEGLAQRLGVGGNVVFLGYRDDLVGLLPAADAWLMTSLNEGMPISMIEAMAAGIPIVTTPWNGAAAMLEGGRCGWVSSSMSPESFATALESALRDPAEARERGGRARARAVQLFSIERTAQQYVALYHTLVGA